MAVGKPLPDDALERPISALRIIDAKVDPRIVPDIELGKDSVEDASRHNALASRLWQARVE